MTYDGTPYPHPVTWAELKKRLSEDAVGRVPVPDYRSVDADLRCSCIRSLGDNDNCRVHGPPPERGVTITLPPELARALYDALCDAALGDLDEDDQDILVGALGAAMREAGE